MLCKRLTPSLFNNFHGTCYLHYIYYLFFNILYLFIIISLKNWQTLIFNLRQTSSFREGKDSKGLNPVSAVAQHIAE